MTDLAENLSGKFIVIDGPDGAGKSTHASMLAEYLQSCGVRVRRVRDPGGTPIGDDIRRILLDRNRSEMTVACELMLYMASRSQMARQVIAPALADGQCVLGDRYVSSTIAYQGAGGADVRTIEMVAEAAVGKTKPDLTLILDIDAQAGLARAKRTSEPDRVESKAVEFHRKVRDIFARMAEERPRRFVLIDTSGEIGLVQDRLREVIRTWRWEE